LIIGWRVAAVGVIPHPMQVSKTDTKASRFGGAFKTSTGTVVTQEWITDAIRSCEQVQDVDVVDMKIEKKGGDGSTVYEAFIKAKIGQAASREYHWIIREVPKVSTSIDPQVCTVLPA
jgi:hypothetical protein